MEEEKRTSLDNVGLPFCIRVEREKPHIFYILCAKTLIRYVANAWIRPSKQPFQPTATALCSSKLAHAERHIAFAVANDARIPYDNLLTFCSVLSPHRVD